MGRASLQRALASIDAQETLPREVVVVAACGPAHPPLPAMNPAVQVRLVMPPPPQDRLPRAMAANAGLDAASSEWIGFLDDDDELLPNHLATLVPAALEAHTRLGKDGRLTYALSQGVDAAGVNTDVYGRSFTRVKFWESTILTIMSALFHRSLLADGCRVDETLSLHEDWDFWLQCAQRTRFQYIEKTTSLWHGAEGESGCGFGANHDEARYVSAQDVVRRKWAAEREAALTQIAEASRQAVAANAAGDQMSAIRLSQFVLKQDPENVNAANLLGMITLQRGDLVSAHQLLTVAVANAPPHFGLFYNMGLVEEARGNAAMARSWFKKGLALNPAHAGLQRKLAPG
jgi:tetratricopeptide (TPR) repeat protein